jgi:hypothetical protein
VSTEAVLEALARKYRTDKRPLGYIPRYEQYVAAEIAPIDIVVDDGSHVSHDVIVHSSLSARRRNSSGTERPTRDAAA